MYVEVINTIMGEHRFSPVKATISASCAAQPCVVYNAQRAANSSTRVGLAFRRGWPSKRRINHPPDGQLLSARRRPIVRACDAAWCAARPSRQRDYELPHIKVNRRRIETPRGGARKYSPVPNYH